MKIDRGHDSDASPWFLNGGGACAALLRKREWRDTGLGVPETWPASLGHAVATVLSSLQPMSVVWGSDHRLFYNDAYGELLADRHPQSLGEPYAQVFADIWPHVRTAVGNVMRGEPQLWRDTWLPYASRSSAGGYYTFTFTPIRSDQGTVEGFLNIATDTTAVVLAQRAAADEIARFAGLFGQAPGFMAVTRGAGHVIELTNPPFQELVGDRQVRGKTVAEALPDAAAQGFVDILDQVYQTGAPYAGKGTRYSMQIDPHDPPIDRFIDFVYQPIRDAANQVSGIFVQGFDITDRRRALNELQAAETQLQGVLAAAEIGTWVWNLGDHLVVHDSNFARLWGWGPEPRPAAEHFARIHPDDVGKVEAAVNAALVSGHLYVREYRIVLDDGSVRWLGGRGKVHKAADGAPVRIAGLVIDIGDLKALEEALLAADRRKDDFLAMLAHELRNPLAPIRAAADVLSMSRLDAPGIAKVSQVISRQVTHMTGLLDDLMDVSRVAGGLVDLDETILSAQQLISAAIEQAQPAIEGKQHHLVVHTPPSPAHVRGDEKRLVQVFVNLLGNATKYTNPGGTIVLRLEAKGDLVVVSVADNGIGMTQETEAMAFELFAQAKRTAARSEGGLGIGLALVKSLVELHNGSVTAHSAGLGKGSEFVVALPRVAATTALDTAASPQSLRTPAHSLQVMVVDDNHDAGAMLGLLVETLGHSVVVKPDAAAALTHAESQPADVCLLDIGLPGMDGYELARELRRREGMGNSVLVAVTGYGQEADRQASAAAGFAHHLVKPVDTRNLTAILNAAAGLKAGS